MVLLLLGVVMVLLLLLGLVVVLLVLLLVVVLLLLVLLGVVLLVLLVMLLLLLLLRGVELLVVERSMRELRRRADLPGLGLKRHHVVVERQGRSTFAEIFALDVDLPVPLRVSRAVQTPGSVGAPPVELRRRQHLGGTRTLNPKIL